jgi:hypothetical protein
VPNPGCLALLPSGLGLGWLLLLSLHQEQQRMAEQAPLQTCGKVVTTSVGQQ